MFSFITGQSMLLSPGPDSREQTLLYSFLNAGVVSIDPHLALPPRFCLLAPTRRTISVTRPLSCGHTYPRAVNILSAKAAHLQTIFHSNQICQ